MTSNIAMGSRFERLTVTGSSIRTGFVACTCDCGSTKEIRARNLIKGVTRSCGCLHREQIAMRRRTHGATETLTWKRWRSMLARCTMPNTKSYPRYGGRGIKVCDLWLKSFDAFLADLGECPGPEYTLERDNYDGAYEPNNCRWATRKEQNRNSSRNRVIEFDGQSKCLTEWAEATGINVRTIMTRLNKGWAVEKALTMTVRPHKPRRQFTKTYRNSKGNA